MTGKPSRREPTPLAAIKPQVDGRAALMLSAARRWRRLAGPGTARRLPLLDVEKGAWIIGIPSPMWQAELDRLARQSAEQGSKLPRLVGRLMENGPPAEDKTPGQIEKPPPAGAGAAQRLRWLMERLTEKDHSR